MLHNLLSAEVLILCEAEQSFSLEASAVTRVRFIELLHCSMLYVLDLNTIQLVCTVHVLYMHTVCRRL